MSQIDPDDYQNEGSSALKDAANKAGKTVTKKIAKKAVKLLVTKAGLPVILGIVAVVLILGMIAISIFVIVASGGEEAKPEGSGYWGGDISELGANEIPAQFIPIYKAAEQNMVFHGIYLLHIIGWKHVFLPLIQCFLQLGPKGTCSSCLVRGLDGGILLAVD